jgi:hypothetical protein
MHVNVMMQKIGQIEIRNQKNSAHSMLTMANMHGLMSYFNLNIQVSYFYKEYLAIILFKYIEYSVLSTEE